MNLAERGIILHQKTGEVHEYINYYLFQNTKDVNLPEIRLKKGENAGNGLKMLLAPKRPE